MDTIDPKVEAERLRQVRAMIEDILREFDICASVVLAGRAGRAEVFSFLNPTWSVVNLKQTPQGDELRIRSKLADYGGDREKQVLHQAWSAGAVSSLGLRTAELALTLVRISEVVDKATGAEHTELPRDDPRDEQ